MKSEYVHVLGRVDDLLSFYNHSRLFVAPSRYAAGIPIKVLEAVAHGLPAVVSPLLANQLGWQENQDLLVGRDPEEFAKKVIALYSKRDLFYLLRQNGLDRIQREYGREHFVASLERVLKSATETHHSKKASLAPQNGSN